MIDRGYNDMAFAVELAVSVVCTLDKRACRRMNPTSVVVPVAIVRHNGLTLSSVLQNESRTDNTESKVCDKQTLAQVIDRIGDKMSCRYLPEACNALMGTTLHNSRRARSARFGQTAAVHDLQIARRIRNFIFPLI